MARTLFKSIVLSTILLLVCAVGYWQWSANQKVRAGAQSFAIAAGDGVSIVAEHLVEQGVLAEPYTFILWSYQRGVTGSLKAGEYEIDPDLTLMALLEKFVSGDVIRYSVTFVEGWTFRQYLQQLNRHPKIKHTVDAHPDTQIMSTLGHGGLHPEGRFFPDTYVFPADTADIDILRQAFDRMRDVLQREWGRRDPNLGLESADAALILASIIEKETGKADERPRISAVFHNRLRNNMRLQTDPTVIYGLGDEFTGNLKRTHLRRDTPYNTYTRSGLPPTPIANPGVEAIHAALHPAQTDALYFVARGDGSHYFSSTLGEHNDAVARYQLSGRERAPSSGDGHE